MNETIKNILERRSIRGYETTQVKDEDVQILLQCAQYAPTARGIQPWHFTVVQDRKFLTDISEANRKFFLSIPDAGARAPAEDPAYDCWRGAPMAIIASGNESLSQSAQVDCANAVQSMAVAAKSLGLGTCYLTSFRVFMNGPANNWILEKLALPEGYTPMLALSVGYGNKEPDPRVPRRENCVNYIK